MPYKVFLDNGKHCVYKHDQAGNKVGKSFGCHPSRKEAVGQLRALYAAEPGAKEWRNDIRQCPHCTGPLSTNLEIDFCPYCAGPVDEEAAMGGNPSRGVKAATMPNSTRVKSYEHDGKRFLVLWTSNAFQDREGEIFETKALEDYVARHDATGDYGRVWFWHVKGTDFATVRWEEVVGRILVSVAEMDQTAYADKMWHAILHPEEYPDVLPNGWGTSHGYAYPVAGKDSGVYKVMEKFETTVLPRHRASNLWGGVKEAIEMVRTAEKDAALKRLVGEEEANKTLKDAEVATSILEQAGISFKEDGSETDEANDNTEAVEEEEAVDDETEEEAEEDVVDDEDQLYELEVTDELVKEIADRVDVKTAVKESMDTAMTGLKEQIIAALAPIIVQTVNEAMKAQLGTKEQIVQQALSGKIALKPWSASQSAETAVAPEHVQGAKEAKTGKGQQDVVADVVRNMLAGSV